MWCGVNRQRAERSRALGPVRPTSDATRAANAAQPTARRRRQRRRPTHPRNTHERAATSDATNTFTVLIIKGVRESTFTVLIKVNTKGKTPRARR